MKYKLAVFDFDGTLADSFPFFVSVFNQLAEQHGFKMVEPDEILALRQYNARQMMRYVGLPAWKVPMVARSFIAMMKRSRASIPLFEGVDELLTHLARHGVDLAIVSSNSLDNVSQVLGAENMKYIRLGECGASIFGKASRLRRVLRNCGIAAADAIYIGDQATDIEAARRAGMAFGAVSWGYGDMGSLRKHFPEEEFGCIADIRRISR